MPNTNTSTRAALLPSDALGASSTSEFQFTKAAANCVLNFEGSNVLNKRPFRIKVWGRSTTGASTNLTIKLYLGTTSGTNLATSGACAVNTVSANWYMSVLVQVDSVSQKLQGIIEEGWINATAIATAVLTTGATAVDPAIEGTTTFTVSGTHSASNAGTTSVLEGFELEPI